MFKRTTLQIATYGIVCLAILLVPSFMNDAFILNKYARYLVLGILAMALSLSWGYAGILNLGQAASFGLGSYCMAMALKLRTVPVHTGKTGLPDFMVWNNVETLPWFWEPFYSLTFTIFAGIAVPVAFAMQYPSPDSFPPAGAVCRKGPVMIDRTRVLHAAVGE